MKIIEMSVTDSSVHLVLADQPLQEESAEWIEVQVNRLPEDLEDPYLSDLQLHSLLRVCELLKPEIQRLRKLAGRQFGGG